MSYSWSVNLYDEEGDVFDKCVMVHCGENAILRFQDAEHLENFAKQILRWLPEIKETNPDA